MQSSKSEGYQPSELGDGSGDCSSIFALTKRSEVQNKGANPIKLFTP